MSGEFSKGLDFSNTICIAFRVHEISLFKITRYRNAPYSMLENFLFKLIAGANTPRGLVLKKFSQLLVHVLNLNVRIFLGFSTDTKHESVIQAGENFSWVSKKTRQDGPQRLR